MDSCGVTAPLSVALKASSEGHPTGGQDFKPCLDLPLCLDHETSGRMGLTSTHEQNGSIGENRIGRSVTGLRKRGVETFLRTRV